MNSNLVSDWFGDSFLKLHPRLQQLHKSGGTLSGAVNLQIATGIAGYIGRRIAKKLAIPFDPREQLFSVSIMHAPDGLHWNRSFSHSKMHSVFLPVGTLQNGYWLETTGALKLHLTVDIKEGGWYWRCLKIKFKKVTLSRYFLPHVNAYKKIENEKYRFYVGFSFPIFGEVLSYSGLLDSVDSTIS